ncbi:MAG: hypothetical protein J6X81_04725 [Muribaculaceae bacterium]|nr:hypothetical protein [Muribaculaceae bacterium]
MKKVLISLLLLACVAGVFAFTCPARSAHVDAVAKDVEHSLNQFADENLKEEKGIGAIGSMVGRLITGPVASTVVDTQLDYHNYVVCSSTTFTYDGETSTVSFGILGRIFTFHQDAVLKYLREKKSTLLGS